MPDSRLSAARARAREELQKAAAEKDPASEKQETERQARDGRTERDKVGASRHTRRIEAPC